MIDDKDKRCEECYAGIHMLLRNDPMCGTHLHQKKCPLGYAVKQIPIRTEYRGSTYEKKIYVPKEPCIGPVDKKEFYYIKSLGDKK